MTSPTLSPAIVTGGCGFTGYHLVSGLLEVEPDCEIHVIDINIERNRIPGVIYHQCDVSAHSEVEAVFAKVQKPKTIFHTACPDSTAHQDDVFRRVNVMGTRNMLEAARRAKTVQAFVNTCSSSVVHDNLTDLHDIDETFPVLKYPQQKRVYTLTKAEAEAEVLAANRQGGDASMLTTSLRPATTFGPRDDVCMGKIVANARAGKAKFQTGTGGNYYDFVYVTNVADAHFLAARALVRAYGKPAFPKDERVDGETFFITNDEPIEFWHFQRGIAASVGLPVRQEDIVVIHKWIALIFAFISEWATWIRTAGKGHPTVTREVVHLTTLTRTINGEKARKVLGYQPRVSMEEGLAIAGKWFMEEAARSETGKKNV
ncbi:hypothetical protein HIM_09747 [Hirsutella minnesotensis 3608]|uniref:3-beta hydroxysteroid dehydrogenase/isomerase domain-containing protein n=1 Tax=Hirsutella minnesotensis 3608 TaxID=1043627 RepID=A0A0F7ZXK5_9HYPO|nr:hypothetical protein HIM_09747 [Hirsutella minnesotensis 3608]